jgi:class 3 adenylate cyclase
MAMGSPGEPGKADPIAQYLGDGLLVYFGYPQAHENDAQRAVRTGRGMLDAL